MLSIWLVLSHLFSTNPLPYHLLSVTLHAGNAWLIFWLLRRFKARTVTAVLPALLFLLSPITPEAVTWSSGYFDLFSLFFILLGLCFYTVFLERGRRRFYVFSIAAMTLAVFSKEMALALVAAVPVLDILFGGVIAKENNPGSDGWLRIMRRVTVRFIPYVIMVIGYLVLRYDEFGTLFNTGFNSGRADLGPLVSLKTFLSPFSTAYFSPAKIEVIYLYMLALLAVAVLLVAVNWRRTAVIKKRLWLFFLALLFLSLMPVSWYVFHGFTSDLFNTRYLYFATAFFLALLAISLLEFARNIKYLVLTGSLALSLLLPFYLFGLHRNNYDWEVRSRFDSHIINEMHALLPDPPADAKIYLAEGAGSQYEELYWCDPLLQPGVRSNYDRYDLHVLQYSETLDTSTYADSGDGYLFVFNGKTGELRLEHSPGR